MSFENYTEEQLRTTVALAFKNADKWPMCSTVESDKRTYTYLMLPGWNDAGEVDPNITLVITSFKGRNPVIKTGVHCWMSKTEKDFLRNLELKLDKWKTRFHIVNVQLRQSWSKVEALRICSQLEACSPTIMQGLLSNDGLDKFIAAEKKQKEQAKKYAEKKGATTFSYTEQRTIASQILRFVEKEYISPMVVSMFKNPEKVSIRTTYNIPAETYYSKMLTGWSMSPRTIDPTGQQLYDSLVEVFNLDPEDILAKLIAAGGVYGADARRFAIKFSDKYNVSGLVDSNPEVRLLAKEKVGKKE